MKIKITFISALFITFSLFLKAQSGSLDLSFGNNGIVTTDIGNVVAYCRAVAIQNDGKIVTAGSFDNNSSTNNSDIVLLRYNANGSLDNSFGTGGKVTTDITVNKDDFAKSVAIQSDGKIVVAGYTFNGANFDFFLGRYNANGIIDSSFDTDGIVTTSIGAGSDYANSLVIQSDGKILVAGNSINGLNFSSSLVRYNTNGSLDTSFDTDGKVTTAIIKNAASVAIQSDGKIVVAGRSGNGITNDFAVERYNINGSLDTSFDTDGKVTTDIRDNDILNSLAIQSDGKIVIAGYSNGNNLDADFSVIRYNTDGSLDNSFDTDGKVTTAIGTMSNDIANSVAMQSDGKIVVAGTSYNGSNNDFSIVRYNTNGSLDNSFDTDGKVTTAIGTTTNDAANSVAIQSDGKIVVVGDNSTSIVVRYDMNGSLDNSFDIDGKVITNFGKGKDIAASVAMQSDGKIVVAGESQNGFYSNFCVTRYNINGSLDSSFGKGGKVTTDITVNKNDFAKSVAIQSDGKIVVAGYCDNGSISNNDFVVVRYNINGSLDSSFNANGIVTTNVGTGDDFASSVAIQSDGKIVVAGHSSNGSNSNDFSVVRYNTNGSLDNSFDTDGKVITTIGTFIAKSVAIQSDGKIVVAGHGSNSSNYDFSLVRYNTNGSLDTSFDTDGKVITAIGNSDDYANSVAIQSNGKIVVAGSSYYGSNNYFDFGVVRYNANGSLDNSFDTDGKVTTAIGTTSGDVAKSVAIQSDGKIVVAGHSSNGSSSNYFSVVRYNTNGSLDTSFDTDGKVTTNIGTGDAKANSMAIQNDGKIVVVGYYEYSSNSTENDFLLVRYDNTIVGIENQVADLPIVSLYPNPTSNLVNLNFTEASKNRIVEVYNLLGEKIFVEQTNELQAKIDLQNYQSGIYFIKVIENNEQVYTQKIIKQ